MTSHHEPDRRWELMIAGFDGHGRPVPMTAAALLSLTESWPTTSASPEPVTNLLSTSRKTFALAWFHYELLVVAATWSFMAVEAALRHRLLPVGTPGLARLVQQGLSQGVLTPQQAEHLGAGRQLRNSLVHSDCQQAWPLGMAAPILRASHDAVASLFPDVRVGARG